MDEPAPRTPGSGLRGAIGSVLRRLGLHGVTVRVVSAEQKRAELRRLAGWRRALTAAIAAPERPTLVVGSLASDAVPVIVALWSRPDRLDAVLDHLAAQQGCPPLRLILWNNNPEHSERYRALLATRRPSGALASIELQESTANLGGIARFVAARHLLVDGYSGPFITLDDDQEISSSFAADLLAARVPGGIAGWWAFTSTEDYWQRTPTAPGEPATYVGTGGAIFDTGIVTDLGFFTELPDRFGFLEDIWACDWVVRHGGMLTKADTTIEFVQEELNQHHGLIYLKAEFVRYLAEAS